MKCKEHVEIGEPFLSELSELLLFPLNKAFVSDDSLRGIYLSGLCVVFVLKSAMISMSGFCLGTAQCGIV